MQASQSQMPQSNLALAPIPLSCVHTKRPMAQALRKGLRHRPRCRFRLNMMLNKLLEKWKSGPHYRTIYLNTSHRFEIKLINSSCMCIGIYDWFTSFIIFCSIFKSCDISRSATFFVIPRFSASIRKSFFLMLKMGI